LTEFYQNLKETYEMKNNFAKIGLHFKMQKSYPKMWNDLNQLHDWTDISESKSSFLFS
jgi:hypothetical protein